MDDLESASQVNGPVSIDLNEIKTLATDNSKLLHFCIFHFKIPNNNIFRDKLNEYFSDLSYHIYWIIVV